MININLGNRFVEQLNLYQTANSDNASIKKNFVVRKLEFGLIIYSLLHKKNNDSLQHELILGSRGGGKSTLLKRIQIEVEENEKLSKKYIAINLAEEQAGIYTLADLWLQVVNELKYKLQFETEFVSFSSFESKDEYANYLYKIIHENCIKAKKKVVLLLDNFDRIVENFTDDGKQLREQLINFNDVALICGSTRMDEHFWRYDKPFYEFFRRHRLEKLSSDEIKALITHWANTLEIEPLKEFVKNNNGKIENIRLLTDGLPRTLQFFIQILLQHTEEYGYTYLKKIMDGVSPLFQERLNMLPSQLRKVVYEMAFIWEACNTKQLVEACMMESKLISANLKTLQEKGLIEIISTATKNNLYRIKERFFNMWIIITQGNPDQKRKAKWLSLFLENWYSDSDLKRIASEHIFLLKSGKKNIDSMLLMSKAISQCKTTTLDERDEIINLTNELAGAFGNSLLNDLPKNSEELINNVGKLISTKEYEKALKLTNEIENESDGVKFGMLGFIYFLQEKFEDSEIYYLKSIDKENKIAFFNLAVLYLELKNYSEAELYFLAALNLGFNHAFFDLAILNERKNNFEEAIKYFLLAIDEGYLKALNNLALLYFKKNQFDLAEKYFLLGEDNNDKDAENNLAVLYYNQNIIDEAERKFLEAISRGNKSALFNLGILYYNQNKFDLAEKYYKLSVKYGYGGAFNNLAVIYYNQNKNNKEALELIDNKKSEIVESTRIIIEIWNGIFNNIENRAIEILKKEEISDSAFLFDLLVQQQKSLVLKLFNNEEIGKALQEEYAVLYYVTLILNNKTENNLLLKIPPEIQSTIDDVLNRINERQKYFGYL